MSMKEKALLIKEDFDQLYDAGKQSVIANSKYIEKQASGKVIRLDDVSEVYHNVKVYADTPTEVIVCGKNIFDELLESGAIDSATGSNLDTTGKRSINYIPIVPNTTYTITREFTTGNIRTRFYDADKNYVGYGFSASTSPMTFTTKDNYYYLRLDLVGDVSNLTEKVQVEFGSATEYEPYIGETITATPNGAEADSICPIMNFLTDNEITVDYYASYGMAEKELAMWKALTFNGARNQYQYAFANTDYTGFVIPDGMCKPSSTIAYMLYNYQGIEAPKGIDCSGFNGTTQASQGNFTFYNSPKLIKIYDMGIPAGILLNNTYSYCRKLEEIEIIRCNENTTFTSAFISCSELEKVKFEGTIASDINLQWSTKLDLESLVSLVNCLKQYESGTEGYHTKTITLSSESWALLDTYVYENMPEWSDAKDWVGGWYGWNFA